MVALTELQQVKAAQKAAASIQPMGDWLENTWSDLKEAEHLASLLVDDLESTLDANRAHPGKDAVTLRLRLDAIERTIWLVSTVWRSLSDLDDRILARLNETAWDEANVERKATTIVETVDKVDKIDRLRNALDRVDVLSALARQLPKGHASPFERVIGDVHDLVCEVHNSLDAEHRQEAQHG